MDQQRTIRFPLRAPLERAHLPALTARLDRLLRHAAPAVVLCDVASAPAGAVTVDALARLQLTAQRRGCTLRITGMSTELRELIAFTGLADVLTG